jgi:hypothetical protein
MLRSTTLRNSCQLRVPCPTPTSCKQLTRPRTVRCPAAAGPTPSSDDMVAAAAWLVVAGATVAAVVATARAYGGAKDALNRRDQFFQDREDKDRREKEEKKARLKRMFDRL